MGYTNSRATMKLWDPYTKKLKYCSSEKFDEHNNKFGKEWSSGSELMTGANIFTLPTLKLNLSDYPFIKYDIFGVDVTVPPIDTHICIVAQYCEHHNMAYIYQSTKNIQWNCNFTVIKIKNVWILSNERKNQQQFIIV